jgi:hypothetical protein
MRVRARSKLSSNQNRDGKDQLPTLAIRRQNRQALLRTAAAWEYELRLAIVLVRELPEAREPLRDQATERGLVHGSKGRQTHNGNRPRFALLCPLLPMGSQDC